VKPIGYALTFSALTLAWLGCSLLKTSPKVVAGLSVLTFTALFVLLLIYEDENS